MQNLFFNYLMLQIRESNRIIEMFEQFPKVAASLKGASRHKLRVFTSTAQLTSNMIFCMWYFGLI
jgi:hypothetical protein